MSRVCLSLKACKIFLASSRKAPLAKSTTSCGSFSTTYSNFGLPASSRSLSCAAHILSISGLATSIASMIALSSTSLAPPSTIKIPCAEPAMVRSMSHSGNACSSLVGLTMYCPLIRPMRTAATGSLNGIEEITTDAEEASTAKMSASLVGSAETTMAVTLVSQAKPSGKMGRMVRSIMREDKVSFLLALPSRLKNPPGILPAA